jgi:hypothetical protein
MNRAAWLQDRRMKKFRDVLSRWEHGAARVSVGRQRVGRLGRSFAPRPVDANRGRVNREALLHCAESNRCARQCI